MKILIEKYKKKKKQAILKSGYSGAYAFIGVGSHSLSNLYPILDYYRVNLKYIVTKTKENADLINANFKNIEGSCNIDAVLNDSEIKGVFVCSSPESHYSIATKVLQSGKNLFIEKPPCTNLDELKSLLLNAEKSNVQALVGVQKRYSPAYNMLKDKAKNVNYYSLKYQTGAYPEGNVLLDLFIHPLDLSIFLFGKAKVASVQVIKKSEASYTYLLHLIHEDGVIGALELSTDYSWTGANEEIIVNTSKGVYKSVNSQDLYYTAKPRVIAGIPLEKVINHKITTVQLIGQNNFLPVKNHNQLYSSGFAGELETFLNLCEGRKSFNRSSFKDLLNTYELIEEINKQV